MFRFFQILYVYITGLYDYLMDLCENMDCSSDAYICCADLINRERLAEYVMAMRNHMYLGIPAMLCSVITYILIGAVTYIFAKKPCIEKKRVLIVTAFPRDVTFFFGPTIVRLKETCKIHILCIVGEALDEVIRKKHQLHDSCKALGISRGRITFFTVPRPSSLEQGGRRVARLMLDFIEKKVIHEVYTYDVGFNKDLDHYSVFKGLAELSRTKNIPFYCQMYMLESVNFIRKFGAFIDISLSMLTSKHVFIASVSEHNAIVNAVGLHDPQPFWSRYFYYIFFRYMYINSYKRVEEEDIELILQEIEDVPF